MDIAVEILVTIFYLVGILALIWELEVILKPEQVQKKLGRIKEKGNNKDDISTFTDQQKTLGLLHLGYMLWVFVGLFFTFQWGLFLMFLLFSFIPVKTVFARRINGIVSFVVVLLMCINHFHLHIPFF